MMSWKPTVVQNPQEPVPFDSGTFPLNFRENLERKNRRTPARTGAPNATRISSHIIFSLTKSTGWIFLFGSDLEIEYNECRQQWLQVRYAKQLERSRIRRASG
ncbi:hypothetical protein F0562_007329 [Nyssa sinensis]|uniref:Uncharacterized protein n=1 Tax=Nyssa sinensis TaxID=561372 RepID=A0A5J5A5K6_9ASTE|nr:hypothetical protein F0562_007329 [Nyssa sinensis]